MTMTDDIHKEQAEVTKLKQSLGKLIASAIKDMPEEEIRYRLDGSDYTPGYAKYMSKYPMNDTLAGLGEMAYLLTCGTCFGEI